MNVGAVITAKPDDDHGTIVTVVGEVDLGCHDELFTVLHDAIDAGARTILVDLTETTFLDSGGIGVLVAARNAARVVRSDLSVTGAAGIVARVLQVTGVWESLTDDVPPEEDPDA